MLLRLAVFLYCLASLTPLANAEPPVHLWFEPEWFPGVEGRFAYWTGTAKPTGKWGIAGPGISPEWTQGGESEWNSIGAPADESAAECHREFIVPRAAHYRLWVRYVDHRQKTEPFSIEITQGGRNVAAHEFGSSPVVPAGDEYALYWGFSFAWNSFNVELADGPARLTLRIDKPGEGWRQVDAVLLTDDLAYLPASREKPGFAYESQFADRPPSQSTWRGEAAHFKMVTASDRTKLCGRDFSMWTQIEPDPAWWNAQQIDTLLPYDVFFRFSPPADIRERFHQQYAGRRDLPLLSFPHLLPGLYLGHSPDLSPASAPRQWLQKTKTPFYILTNYANPKYTDAIGPATYQALMTDLADQFLGYIHGEAVGTPGVAPPGQPLAATRRQHVDAWGKKLVDEQVAAWSKIYKTDVDRRHFEKSISCLSVDSTALAHLFHELGAKTVGYELDSTNAHAPMRIAFQRGAARQYGGHWINYASGNFGDACNYFTQQPVVPRGAPGWYHSKYTITDGVTATWYRKLYYLNYLSGADAIFWEQGLGNQWMLPGPGTHHIELSPFGRATEDFQSFVTRLPERGEPLTPVAILLSYGHAYDRVNYDCKMLGFPESPADVELRELFNVCWYPAGIVEGQPAAPDVQSMPGGVFGNLFDVLVDRPAKAEAILNYPVVWAAGDVDLGADWIPVLREYLRRGGTFVVNIEAAKSLPEELTGLLASGHLQRHEKWSAADGSPQACVPYQVAQVQLQGAEAILHAAPDIPLATRHRVGPGAVIVTLVPRLLGLDERAHPMLPRLLSDLTAGLLPLEVTHADGRRLSGEVMYQVNRTSDGYLVFLMSTRGVDKTPSGVARVDRRAAVEVVIRTSLPLASVREHTGPRNLEVENDGEGHFVVRVSLPAGDVAVVGLQTRPGS